MTERERDVKIKNEREYVCKTEVCFLTKTFFRGGENASKPNVSKQFNVIRLFFSNSV